MPQNPEFVRLADHMVNGLCVDMESGWSISGYDVQPFPEDRQQSRFVRRKINAGVLEAATQAEYDEAHPQEDESDDEKQAKQLVDVVKAVSQRGGNQEHVLRAKESGRHSAVQTARAKAKLIERGIDVEDDADLDEIEYAEEADRLERLTQEQEEEGLTTDDPEEQQERTATHARKGTAKKATATTRKRRS